MITDHPGLARQTWRRLRTASGSTDLDEVEERLDQVAEAVGENHDLTVPLAAMVARVESLVVPALERRHRPSVGGEAAADPVSETGGTADRAL